MPARKRGSAVANGTDNAEPVAKRRSSRQAAAATASKGAAEADPAVNLDTTRSADPAPTNPPKKAAAKASLSSQAKASGRGSATTEDDKPKPPKASKQAASSSSAAKPDKKESKKTKAAKHNEEKGAGRAGSEDPDVDSIPAVNPDAPKHEGEWYWLLKAEPETRMENGHDVRFSIDDLRAKTKPEGWDGIRAYPARNNMRNMNVGDKAFFYHSNCKEPGIVGIMEIVKEFSEDKSARRPGTPYYDPSSTKDKPKWDLVHVEFRKKFAVPIYLKELRTMGEAGGPLQEMQMLKLGRLSVSKVSAGEWKTLCELADKKAKEAGLEHEE
ncbi:AT DNA binding [Cordyceps militaris]|uniref:Thymocyte nuclear protein 1 n=1 Tax=Cordyceps militaris TaxID=73501 RepID=A0A2H4SNC6_CORMI|nr:AT DNA binding [Cordyceps militaris]